LWRDDSSNLAFHRQKSKFTKKGLARARALPEVPRHTQFQLSPVQYSQLASIELNWSNNICSQICPVGLRLLISLDLKIQIRFTGFIGNG
jgi:hypothetical protein